MGRLTSTCGFSKGAEHDLCDKVSDDWAGDGNCVAFVDFADREDIADGVQDCETYCKQGRAICVRAANATNDKCKPPDVECSEERNYQEYRICACQQDTSPTPTPSPTPQPTPRPTTTTTVTTTMDPCQDCPELEKSGKCDDRDKQTREKYGKICDHCRRFCTGGVLPP